MPTLKLMVLDEGKRPRGNGFATKIAQAIDDRSERGDFGKAIQSFLNQARRVVARRIMTGLFEERIRERERIARELHDTLIQGTQALILSVHVLSDQLPDDDPMRGSLAHLLQRADSVMTQGRDRILNLRESAGVGVDLAGFLVRNWSDLRGEGDFRFRVEGPHHRVEPYVADEICMIGREALTNALRHSKATTIEARVVFEAHSLRLCVRDDGVGIGPDANMADSRFGHWGLPGMRERADELGASFEVRSGPCSGTTIRLIVPAKVAYAPDEGIISGWLKRLLPPELGKSPKQ